MLRFRRLVLSFLSDLRYVVLRRLHVILRRRLVSGLLARSRAHAAVGFAVDVRRQLRALFRGLRHELRAELFKRLHDVWLFRRLCFLLLELFRRLQHVRL
jgi:hypothetical protein